MLESLTVREYEILQLLADGFSNQEIAEKLTISLGTVKAHNHNIFSKLAVRNRTQALRSAQELGLVETLGKAETYPSKPFHNLPLLLGPLIGRTNELVMLSALLSDSQSRIITLLGPGGIGKTSLAVQTARENLAHFPDGIFLISFEQVLEPDGIIPIIANTLSLSSHVIGNLTTYVQEALRNKKLLLILDNFEHLASGVDILLDLLQASKQLRLLLTSRERLNISSEQVFVLDGLDYSHSATDPSTLPAAQLLLHRVRLLNPAFEIEKVEDWQHIIRICHLTEGMPLAIILAATWLEHLSFAQIANEIHQGTHLLKSHLHDLPERQQSIRATIQASWTRLSVDEQRIFTHLSIFHAGFSRGAAQAIVGADLQALQKLIYRSLLRASQGRYEIHGLLRQFAWEKLQESENFAEIAINHSQYYLDWLASLQTDLEGKRQTEALEEINRDLPNIRIAWTWAIYQRASHLIEKSLNSLYLFFMMTGRLREGIEHFQELRKLLEENQSPLLNRMQIYLYNLLLPQQYETFQKTDLEVCLDLAEKQKALLDIALASELLGTYVAYVLHDYHSSIHLFKKALSMLQAQNTLFHLAYVYRKLGYSYLQTEGLPTLMECTEKAYRIAKQQGDFFNMRAALGNLGSAALYLGRYYEAEQYYRDALSDTKLMTTSRSQLIYFVHILFLRGKFEEGKKFLQLEQENNQSFLDLNGAAFSYALCSFLASIEARYEDAIALALQSLSYGNSDITGNLVANLSAAMAYCGLKDQANAENYLTQTFLKSRNMKFYASVTWGLPILQIIRLQEGRLKEAAVYEALLRIHPLCARDWLKHWKLFTDSKEILQSNLSQTELKEAETQASTLQLESILAEFISKES